MIASLLRTLADLARLRRQSRNRDESPPFVNGLAIGALVGAAIAGSAVWRRVRKSAAAAGDKSRSRT